MARPRRAFTAFAWHLLGAVVLQLLLCCSCQQQQARGTQPAIKTRVLDATVVLESGTYTEGQRWQDSSSTLVDCSQLKGKPAYLVRCGSAA